MRRVLLIAGLLSIALVIASPAVAATTVAMSMNLTEPLKAGTPGSSPCPDIGLAVNCGSGEVHPFGHATEEVNIGVCGDSCNYREIDLPQGAIVLQETITNVTCPGVCGSRSFGPPLTIWLSDVVIGGTGVFAGATGALTGAIGVAGWGGVLRLTGTVTLNS